MRNLIILIAILAISINCKAQVKSPANQSYVGGTVTMTDLNAVIGGSWSSSSTSIATCTTSTSSSGIRSVVTGVTQGTVKIRYKATGVNDSFSLYISTSDSSGYYFTPLGLRLKDCDGVTNLAMWSAAANYHQISYSLGSYQIGFQGMLSGGMLVIPAAKIKNFSGIAPRSTPDSVIAQIAASTF